MAKRTADVYLEQWDYHQTHRRLWEPLWEELAEFSQPRKQNISFQRTPGQPQTERLFDSVGVEAASLLAASMQGSLTSDATQWFGLTVRGAKLPRNHQLNILLEQCAADLYAEINDSNHSSEFAEIYQDMVVFGIGCIFVEELPPSIGSYFGGIRHETIHPGSYCIEENENGIVDTVYRDFELSARAAARKFGEDKLGAASLAKLKKNATDKCKFLHVVSPTDDPSPLPGSRQYAAHRAFKSCYIDVDSKKVVEEGGFHEFPYMVPRWSKTSGEIYGRGPAYIALPNLKTLNTAVMLKLQALALAIKPPLKVRDAGVIGKVKFQPAGLTYVRDMEAIQPINVGTRFDVAEVEEDKLRAAIRRVFLTDQLQLQDGPQMTAYEVNVRYELQQRVLGPTLGRTAKELLDPYITRVFWMKARRAAKDPESPYTKLIQEMKKARFAMDIVYEGPLARAQRVQESVATNRFFNLIGPLAAIKPEVMDKVDLDEVVDVHAMSVGVPARILAPPEAVEAIRSGRREAQEAAAAQQQVESAAGVANQMAPVLKTLNESQAGLKAVQSPGIVPSGVGA